MAEAEEVSASAGAVSLWDYRDNQAGYESDDSGDDDVDPINGSQEDSSDIQGFANHSLLVAQTTLVQLFGDLCLKSGSSDAMQPERNPMLNSVVLETFFRVADLEDLKTFRLVSKLWWRESLPRFRQDFRLALKDVGKDPDPHAELTDYMETSNIPGDPYRLIQFPFQKYRLQGWRLDVEGEEMQCEFFIKFGAKMKDLTICQSIFASNLDYYNVLLALTPNLVALCLEENKYMKTETDKLCGSPMNTQGNLRKLSFKLVEINRETIIASRERAIDGNDEFNINLNFPPSSWKDLLAMFPNLEKVRLANVMSNKARFATLGLLAFFEAIGEVKEAGGTCHLKSLDIVDALAPATQEFNMRIVEKFCELRLPLTSLSIDIGVTTKKAVFKKLLKIHAPTLRHLKIFRAPYAEPYYSFPFDVQMIALEELVLVGPVCYDLEFLEHMPSLRSLRTVDRNLNPFSKPLLPLLGQEVLEPMEHVSLVENTDFEDDDIKDLVALNLEEFINGDELCYAGEVFALTRLMPNLKLARLGLDNKGVKAAYENWKNLQDLHIEPYEVLEEDFKSRCVVIMD